MDVQHSVKYLMKLVKQEEHEEEQIMDNNNNSRMQLQILCIIIFLLDQMMRRKNSVNIQWLYKMYWKQSQGLQGRLRPTMFSREGLHSKPLKL